MPVWFRKSRHHEVLDSYALLETGKWQAIRETLDDLKANCESVFLVAHFRQTFEVLQEKLATWGVGYEMPTSHLSPNDIFEEKLFEGQRVHLVLAELLRSRENLLPNFDPKMTGTFSVVVCERHPLPKYDQQLKQFIRAINIPTRTGYFLSLEDPLIRLAISDTAVTVMKQFGLNDHDLVTSQILTRRIDHFTRQLNASVGEEISADSPQKWLSQNYQGKK